MELSGQLQAPVAFTPVKEPSKFTTYEVGWALVLVWTRWWKQGFLPPTGIEHRFYGRPARQVATMARQFPFNIVLDVSRHRGTNRASITVKFCRKLEVWNVAACPCWNKLSWNYIIECKIYKSLIIKAVLLPVKWHLIHPSGVHNYAFPPH
jgi:hypothetical protein